MHNIASSLSDVELRLRRYFEPDGVRSRELKHNLLDRLLDIGQTYVIGGLARDLAFFGANGRPISDIDFVISGNANALDRLAKFLGCTPNRFGGYGLVSGGMKVDFWSLDRTWAKVERHVHVQKPEHLLKCTFFDWDAIIYDVGKKKVLADQKYLDRLHRRVIEINLLPNPSPHGNFVRALRRLVMFDLRPGKRLRWFVNDGLRKHTWESVQDAERGAFHTCYLNQFVSGKDFEKRYLIDHVHKIVGTDDRRQLSLPF